MPQTRQLAAILFADIVGFTSLMQVDEHRANLTRKKLYSSLEAQCAHRQGKILKFSGDGVLCMFQSPVEAVRAAMEVQAAMRQDPIVPLRIGIHQGDVIIDENDIFGDGVNLASRLESFAVAGSIFISGKVQDEIKNQADIQSKSLGRYAFKNVADPNHIYAISNDGLLVPSPKSLAGKGGNLIREKNRNLAIGLGVLAILLISWFAFQYLGKHNNSGGIKSIAVLPFTNLTGDTSTPVYFTEGVTEDILNQLSKIADLKVKSSQASFAYRHSDMSMKQIGENLNVKTVLKGSIQRQGDLLRCRASLIDCASEEIIWSEQYDRKMDDIFKVQSDIALQISSKLKANLSDREKSQIISIPTQNTVAYESYLQARIMTSNEFASKTDLEKALKLLNQAIDLDAGFSEAYYVKGLYFYKMSEFGMPYPKWKDSASYYYQQALNINPQKVDPLIGLYFLDQDKSLLEKAYSIDPQNKAARYRYGVRKYRDGDTTGIPLFLSSNAENIRRDDPNSSATLGDFYRNAGDYQTAEYYYIKQLALDTTLGASYNKLNVLYTASNEKLKRLNVMRKWYQITNPKNSGLLDQMHWAYLVSGKLDSAEIILKQNFELEKKFEDQTQKLPVRHRLGYIKYLRGNKEEGMNLIKEERENQLNILNGKSGHGVWFPGLEATYYDLTAIESFLGNKASALNYLDSMIKYPINWDWGYRNDPLLNNIRKEPSFIGFIKKLDDRDQRNTAALNRAMRTFEKENNIPYPPKEMKN
jgi:adenylate cyclase